MSSDMDFSFHQQPPESTPPALNFPKNLPSPRNLPPPPHTSTAPPKVPPRQQIVASTVMHSAVSDNAQPIQLKGRGSPLPNPTGMHRKISQTGIKILSPNTQQSHSSPPQASIGQQSDLVKQKDDVYVSLPTNEVYVSLPTTSTQSVSEKPIAKGPQEKYETATNKLKLKQDNLTVAYDQAAKMTQKLNETSTGQQAAKEANYQLEKAKKAVSEAVKQYHAQAIKTLKVYNDQCKNVLKNTEKNRSASQTDIRKHIHFAVTVATKIREMIEFNNTLPPDIAKKLAAEQFRELRKLERVSAGFIDIASEELKKARNDLATFNSNNTGPANSVKQAYLTYLVSVQKTNLKNAYIALRTLAMAKEKTHPKSDPDILKKLEALLQIDHADYDKALLNEAAAENAYLYQS